MPTLDEAPHDVQAAIAMYGVPREDVVEVGWWWDGSRLHVAAKIAPKVDRVDMTISTRPVE